MTTFRITCFPFPDKAVVSRMSDSLTATRVFAHRAYVLGACVLGACVGTCISVPFCFFRPIVRPVTRLSGRAKAIIIALMLPEIPAAS